MRHLLIAFLLLVFSIQGTVVATGEDPIAAVKAELRQVHGPADALSSPADRQAGDDADAGSPDGSSMIDELSDYLPGGLWFPDAVHLVFTPAFSSMSFLSVDLPASRPPPRF